MWKYWNQWRANFVSEHNLKINLFFIVLTWVAHNSVSHGMSSFILFVCNMKSSAFFLWKFYGRNVWVNRTMHTTSGGLLACVLMNKWFAATTLIRTIAIIKHCRCRKIPSSLNRSWIRPDTSWAAFMSIVWYFFGPERRTNQWRKFTALLNSTRYFEWTFLSMELNPTIWANRKEVHRDYRLTKHWSIMVESIQWYNKYKDKFIRIETLLRFDS